jgi:hypothetical protein
MGEAHQAVDVEGQREGEALSELADCEGRTSRLDARVAELNHALLERLPAERAYVLGHRDDPADKSIRPVLERLLRGDGSAPDFSLECRDRICRLTLIDFEPARGAEVTTALQRDVELGRHVSGVTFAGEARSADMLSETGVREAHIYLRLNALDPPSK